MCISGTGDQRSSLVRTGMSSLKGQTPYVICDVGPTVLIPRITVFPRSRSVKIG